MQIIAGKPLKSNKSRKRRKRSRNYEHFVKINLKKNEI